MSEVITVNKVIFLKKSTEELEERKNIHVRKCFFFLFNILNKSFDLEKGKGQGTKL